MKKPRLSFEGSAILFLISAAVAHEGSSGGGFAGACESGTFCHSVIDSFGHGVFGTGWAGFIAVFGIWLVGLFALLRYIIKNLEVEFREYELEDDDDSFTLLSK